MDMIIQWGVLKHLRKEIKAKASIIITAIILDAIVLSAFLWIKGSNDLLVVIIAAGMIAMIFVGEKWFLKRKT
jgi:hypothetical protein